MSYLCGPQLLNSYILIIATPFLCFPSLKGSSCCLQLLLHDSGWVLFKRLFCLLLEGNIRETLEERGIGNIFQNRTPTAQKIRARIAKWIIPN
jgi:hypothetical protein